MATHDPLRLTRIEAHRLFGLYDHDIPLNPSQRVTLLHGPNGVGKTAILCMIDGLLNKRLDYFRSIPFERFCLSFADGRTLVLRSITGGDGTRTGYSLQLSSSTGQPYQQAEFKALGKIDAIAAEFTFLRRHDAWNDTWVDHRDGELLSESDVTSRYGDQLPKGRHPEAEDEDPEWFNLLLADVNTHLIGAQRLVELQRQGTERYYYRGRFRNTSIPSVISRSMAFTRKLRDTMAQYGRRSQTLDQSFPQRLMSATARLTEEQLRDRMSSLDRKTSELKDLGILDTTPTHPFPVEQLSDLDATRARVMTLYIRDTEDKLDALEHLATRIRVLLENMNSKYRHKRVRIDREKGLTVEDDVGRELALDSLSSGEQHELVLHYDLLFRVPENTVVLVDEPELSLHVAWQKRFLPDVLEVAKLSSLDVVVATHSPFIVGDHTELMIGLGDND